MPRTAAFVRLASVTVGVAVAMLAVVALPAGAETVTLTAADGGKVFGDVWRAGGARPPVIVAFHQDGSSAAEYAPLAPRLVGAGFTVLAIDQRRGDSAFGGNNRTVAARGGETGYDEALPDLEAALAWARAEAKGAPVVVWGSSYSASLVFLLAAAHPREVSGIVAYSPAEYLRGKQTVRRAAAKVAVPVFIGQSSKAEEVASGAAILKAVAAPDKQQFVATTPSVHGSSTLRADSNGAGAEAQWAAVLKFLARFNKA